MGEFNHYVTTNTLPIVHVQHTSQVSIAVLPMYTTYNYTYLDEGTKVAKLKMDLN